MRHNGATWRNSVSSRDGMFWNVRPYTLGIIIPRIPKVCKMNGYRLPQGYQTSRVAPSWAHPAPPWAPMNPTLSITFPGPWGPLFGPPYRPNSPLLCPNRELSLNLTCFSVGSQTCFQVGKLSKHLSNFHQSKSQSVEICQASMKSSS